MIRQVIKNLPMRSTTVLVLGTNLLPSEMKNGVVYLRYILLVGSQPSLLDKIFYIS